MNLPKSSRQPWHGPGQRIPRNPPFSSSAPTRPCSSWGRRVLSWFLFLSGGLGLAGWARAQSPPPYIPPIRTVAVTVGQPISPIHFNVYGGRVPTSALVLGASSSNPTWLPNSSLTISGISSNRLLTISPAPSGIGTSRITLTAFDGVDTAARTFSFWIVPGGSVRQVDPGWASLANPFIRGKNLLSEVIPLPAAGTRIYRWNPSASGFDIAEFDDLSATWVPNMNLAPGDGAFVYSPVSQSFTFTGLIPSGPPSPPRPAFASQFYKSSLLPVPSTFEDVLGFAPLEGDKVQLYEGTYSELPTVPSQSFSFINGTWAPKEPIINVSMTALFDLVPALLPPSIVTPPASQSAEPGADVTFTVVATGGSPLSYQWFKDAAGIPGATSPSLLLPSVAAGDVGDYSVTVSNPAGSVTSSNATLTLHPVDCFAIFCPTGVQAHCDSPTGTVVRFEVGVSNYCNPENPVLRTCSPESGTVFHTGENPVVCRAVSQVNGIWRTNECSFVVTVLADCPSNSPGSCLDLSSFSDGLKPNPWELPDYKLEGFFPDGSSRPNLQVGPWGLLRGLIIEGPLDIEMAAPCSVVSLAVSNNVQCEAYDVDGRLLDSITSTPWASLTPETVELRSIFTPIHRVRLLPTQSLGLLVRICCETYQVNGVTATETCQDATAPQIVPNPWITDGLTWTARRADHSLEPDGHIDPPGTSYPSEAYAGYHVEYEVELALGTPARRVTIEFYEQSGLVDFVGYDEDHAEVARQQRLGGTPAPESMNLITAGNLIRTVVVTSPNARCKIRKVCLGFEKESSCLAFGASPAEFLPNPLVRDGITFTTRDLSGVAKPFNATRSIGGDVGLVLAPRTEIELPVPGEHVDLTFRGYSEAVMAEGFDADGRSIDSTVLTTGPDPATTITLNGGIKKVLLSASGTNAILTGLCVPSNGDPSKAVGPYIPLSAAPVGTEGGGLVLSNLSDTVPAGVGVTLGVEPKFHLGFTSDVAAGQMPTGAMFKVTFRARNGERFGSVLSVNEGSVLRTEVDFRSISAPTYGVRLYADNAMVESFTGLSEPLYLLAAPSLIDALKQDDGNIQLVYSWANGAGVALDRNTKPILVTRLEILTERSVIVPLCLCRVDTLWTGINPRIIAPDPLHCFQVVVPRDIEIECAPPGGTPVTFSVTVTNSCTHSTAPIRACSPPSGSLFRVGQTLVTCFAGTMNQPAFGSFYVNVNSSTGGCLVENGSFEMATPAPALDGATPVDLASWTMQGEVSVFRSDAHHFPACEGMNYVLLRAQMVGSIYKEGSLEGHLSKATPIGKEYRVMACVSLERGTGAWIEILISDGTPEGQKSAGLFWVTRMTDWDVYRGSVIPDHTCDRVIVRTVREHNGILSDGNVRVDNIMVCCSPLRMTRCVNPLTCLAAVWSGDGVLQHSTSLDPQAAWSDVNLPVTETPTGEHRVEIPTSPNLPRMFYRLRTP